MDTPFYRRERKRAPHGVPAELVREAILDAAEQGLFCRGYRSVKMADVAKEAGVSVGTVYNHFDGKKPLFVALWARLWNRYYATIDEDYGSDNPLDQFEGFITRTLGFVENNRKMVTAYLRETLPPTDGGARAPARVDLADTEALHRSTTTKLLAAAVRSGDLRSDVDIEELAWAVQVLLQAAILEWVGSPEPLSLRSRGQRLLRCFLQGIAHD